MGFPHFGECSYPSAALHLSVHLSWGACSHGQRRVVAAYGAIGYNRGLPENATADAMGEMVDPKQQRLFAVDTVRHLRDAGFEAYWAGGCVRDELLGRTPKDYDVATSATPDQIRKTFGRGQTAPIGAAFGVIGVIGSKAAGVVEVATFRQDAAYSDGRHPDHVTFSSAEEDASRRDFTVNGLFYDPIRREIIDYVGGREDLAANLLRAIGRPDERLAEDKLRMLRAIRFSVTLGFELHRETFDAICKMADQITVISAERIAMEMRRILVEPRRADGARLLLQTGLAKAVLPEIVPENEDQRRRIERVMAITARLPRPGFPLALAALLHESVDAQGARDVCLRWRLSNNETDRVVWLVQCHSALAGARSMRWSRLQPLLVSSGIDDLLTFHEVASPDGPEEAAYCRSLLTQSPKVLDPPPLITGDHLRARRIRPGPEYRDLLQAVRDAQLDEEIRTEADALALVDRLRQH